MRTLNPCEAANSPLTSSSHHGGRFRKGSSFMYGPCIILILCENMQSRDFPAETNDDLAVRRLAGYVLDKKIAIMDVKAEADIELAQGLITPAQYNAISEFFDGPPLVFSCIKEALKEVRQKTKKMHT